MSFIYLATPHNHHNSLIRTERYRAAQKAASIIFACQIPVYSPIAHWHPIAIHFDLPHGWNYWKFQDEALLRASAELWVILIEGWETSVGIKAEVAIAKALGKPVHYIDPADLEGFCLRYNKDHLMVV